jgi:hypothetical protein
MGLKQLKFGTETIKTSGGDFTVRGLNPDDIRSIMRDDDIDVKALVNKSAELPVGDDGMPDYTVLIAQAIHMAPRLVSHLISLASDEGDDEDAIVAAAMLPLDVQLMAIDAIGRLTFSSAGGLKKVIEIVMRMAAGATNLASELSPSMNGLKESTGK